jgi:hypothetical protein
MLRCSVDIHGLSFKYAGAMPLRFDDIEAALSDADGPIVGARIPGQVEQQRARHTRSVMLP